MISLLVTCAISTLQARYIVVEHTRYGCYKYTKVPDPYESNKRQEGLSDLDERDQSSFLRRDYG